MRAPQSLATEILKQGQRIELNNHIEDFLLKGGTIDVVNGPGEPGANIRPGRRPAAADLLGLPVGDIF